jgi:hypothetical protein
MAVIRELVEINDDMPPRGQEAPPKRGPGRPPGSKSKPRTRPLEDRLREAFGLIGIGIVAVNEYDGTVFLAGSDRLAKSLSDIAAVNDSLRRVLEAALTGGMYGSLLISVSAIALPIAANHGMIPIPAIEVLCRTFDVEVPPGAGYANANGNGSRESDSGSVARIPPAI